MRAEAEAEAEAEAASVRRMMQKLVEKLLARWHRLYLPQRQFQGQSPDALRQAALRATRVEKSLQAVS